MKAYKIGTLIRYTIDGGDEATAMGEVSAVIYYTKGFAYQVDNLEIVRQLNVIDAWTPLKRANKRTKATKTRTNGVVKTAVKVAKKTKLLKGKSVAKSGRKAKSDSAIADMGL